MTPDEITRRIGAMVDDGMASPTPPACVTTPAGTTTTPAVVPTDDVPDTDLKHRAYIRWCRSRAVDLDVPGALDAENLEDPRVLKLIAERRSALLATAPPDAPSDEEVADYSRLIAIVSTDMEKVGRQMETSVELMLRLTDEIKNVLSSGDRPRGYAGSLSLTQPGVDLMLWIHGKLTHALDPAARNLRRHHDLLTTDISAVRRDSLALMSRMR